MKKTLTSKPLQLPRTKYYQLPVKKLMTLFNLARPYIPSRLQNADLSKSITGINIYTYFYSND